MRRSGGYPVWVAQDGRALVVVTPAAGGKVKRLRADPRVEVRPCRRMGQVKEGTRRVTGVAEVLTDRADVARLTQVIATRCGLKYRVVMGIEGLRRSGRAPRVILRISLG